MATAWGTIGVKGLLAKVSPAPLVLGSTTLPQFPTGLCVINLGADYYCLGGKDAGTGSPAPAMRIDGAVARWRFRWRVAAGARTVQCQVLQAANASPRPTLIVRANAGIGVNADVTVTAGVGTGWVTLGPATITPAGSGAVWVEVWNNLNWQAGSAPVFIDNLAVT